MTNRRRDLFRSDQGTSSEYDTVRVVGREFAGYALPDDAVSSYDENSLSIQVISPGGRRPRVYGATEAAGNTLPCKRLVL